MKTYILSGLFAFALLVSAGSVANAQLPTTPRSGGGGVSFAPNITFVKSETVVSTPIEGQADNGRFKIYFDVYASTSDVYIGKNFPPLVTSPSGARIARQYQTFVYMIGSNRDLVDRSFIQKGTKRSFYIESNVVPQDTGSFQASLKSIAWATTSTSTLTAVVNLDPTVFRSSMLVLRAIGNPSATATSTIRNVRIGGQGSSPRVNFYDDYKIVWEGSNLEVVNIDLYDLKGIYKKRTIASNYTVPFSTTTRTYTYEFDAPWSTLDEDLYVIKVVDALNTKVSGNSPKINFEWYRTPVVGTMSLIGSTTPTAKLTMNGGMEVAVSGEFSVRVTAASDTITFGANWFSAIAEKVAPIVESERFSTKYENAQIRRATGDFTLGKNAKGDTTYTIARGKSAVFVLEVDFKPSEMFAGQYVIKLNDLYALGNQQKNVRITAFETPTNRVTVVGERSPYITSITSPVALNREVKIYGQRLSTVSNIAVTQTGATYKLPAAKDGVITFVPSRVGMKEGYVNFQIRGQFGLSNYVWLDVGAPVNTANIFTGFWNFVTSAF